MSNEAHGLRLEHQVFNGPLEVEIVFDTSNTWEKEYDSRGTWKVHEEVNNPRSEYGMVSDGFGFEDSPDCERISGGINTKGPEAVAKKSKRPGRIPGQNVSQRLGQTGE